MVAKNFPAVRANQLHSENQRYVDVTITSAQLLALNATPVTLLAAPPAGYVNIFEGARLALDYNSAAYTTPRDFEIRYTDGSGQLCATAMTGSSFFDATSDKLRYSYPVFSATFTPVAAAAIVAHLAAGEMADGDSPLKVRLFYRQMPTGL